MNVLEGLNPEQEQAVKHFKGPLLILAGAGSGKTRVLTHRIAYLIEEYGVNPWNILAITFTNKAAGEMRERVDNIVTSGAEYIWVSTFHSACVRILRRHIEALGYSRSFTIYDADDQRTLMRDILKYLQLDPKKFKERSVLGAISSAKDEMITPEEYERRAAGDYLKEIYARAYREYEKRLRDSNALDFDDLIVKTIQLLQDNPEILDYYQNRFRYIMVDEYQDTNTAQFELVRLLADSTGEDGRREQNLCVVGDDDQSIYKFRGANIYNILNFETEYPDAKVIKLEKNYRSTQNILDAANAVISHNSMRKDKALWTDQEKGDPIYFAQYGNEYEEAEAVTDGISYAVQTGDADYKDFAILYRTNAQSRVLEEKLVTANIPYRIVGAVNFYQRREIKDLFPKPEVKIGDEMLRIEHLSRTGYFKDVSFNVRAGEIVGLTGVVGAGRTEVVESVCGITNPDEGKVYLEGKEVHIKQPSDAMKEGIILLPEDRQKEGLIMSWGLGRNVTLPTISKYAKNGFNDEKTERDLSKRLLEEVDTKAVDIFQPASSLSGGNQQKVVVAKALSQEMKVVIMDEPTKGVDVGAKAEIYAIMGDLAKKGYAIILISSEMPEILGMSDRIVVMCNGRKTGELGRGEATQEMILELAMEKGTTGKGAAK